MRCLYCGNELALLKKLTGGGEFCSEAHRQKYQEEYNRLALSRLLQAQPVAEEPKPPLRVPTPVKPIPVSTPPLRVQTEAPVVRAVLPEAAPVPEPVIEVKVAAAIETIELSIDPPRVMPSAPVNGEHTEFHSISMDPPQGYKPEADRNTAAARSVESEPASPGPVSCVPKPSQGRSLIAAAQEAAWGRRTAPEYPASQFNGHVGMASAEQVPIAMATKAAGAVAAPHASFVEAREFGQPDPRREIHQSHTGRSGWDFAIEPMELLIFPKPPKATSATWLEAEQRFNARAAEFSGWMRLDLHTTGFDEADGIELVLVPAPPVPAADFVQPAKPAPTPVPDPKPEVSPSSALGELSRLHSGKAEPLPAAVRTPAETVSDPAPIVAPEPADIASPTPALCLQPLPFTLLAMMPGAAKPTNPIHETAVTAAFKTHLPRLSSLPLRPAIVLGFMPEKAAGKPVPVKPEPAIVAETAVPTAKIDAPPPPPPQKTETPRIEIPKRELSKSEHKKAKWEKKNRKAEAKPRETEIPSEAPAKTEETLAGAAILAQVEKVPPPQERLAAPATDVPLLAGLQTNAGFWGRMPGGLKAGAAAAVLALAVIAAVLTKGGSSSAAPPAIPRYVEAGPALLATEGGWSADWVPEPAGQRRLRHVSVFRPSLPLHDYRLDLQGMIETKALGWVIRAKDPKNFYVMKLEMVKPGLNPTIALVRFAVVGGEEQERSQIPLSLNARLDTMYKIRMEVVGQTFTTWIQEKKIDEWTDNRISTGGVGLYNERQERAQIKSVAVTPLVLKSQ